MSEKPLLLSSAKSLVLTNQFPKHRSAWRTAVVVVGLGMVIVGAADTSARFANYMLGEGASVAAFGSVGLLGNLSFTAASSSAVFVPTQLQVPVIGVQAAVEEVGKKADGTMGTPQKFGDVSWYKLGSKPGQAGNAVFAGHVNNALTSAGVFEHLTQVKLGDKVVVSDDQGHSLTYVVVGLDSYDVKEAPAASIFTTEGPSQIVLITCEGVWDEKAHSFDKRLVVTARLSQ